MKQEVRKVLFGREVVKNILGRKGNWCIAAVEVETVHKKF